MNVYEIIPVISYGKYSKSFNNFIFYHSNNSDVSLYFKLLKEKWEGRTEEQLHRIEKVLKDCSNQGIKYLLISMKMDVAKSLKKTEINRALYQKIKKEYDSIPEDFRSIIGKGLKSNNAYNYHNRSKEFRMWSEIYNSTSRDKAVKYHAEAIKQLQKNKRKPAVSLSDKKKVYDLFHKCTEDAIKYPHPTFILAGLNNAAWYFKNDFKRSVLEDISKIGYYSGIYFENGIEILDYLDTICSILRTYRNSDFFSYSKLFIYFYSQVVAEFPEKASKYRANLNYCRRFTDLNFHNESKKEVCASTGLIDFLKFEIKKPNQFAISNKISVTTLYDFINGNSQRIRKSTLCKIVNGLNLKQSFDNHKIINHIIENLNEMRHFEDNWKRFLDLPLLEMKLLLIKSYLTVVLFEEINISMFIRYCEGKENQMKKYIVSDIERMTFFNFSFSKFNSFYQARIELIEELFNIVGRKKEETFKDKGKLITLTKFFEKIRFNREGNLLNIFFRQYVRYSNTNWQFDVNSILKDRFSDKNYFVIEKFCDTLNLDPMYGYLATWYLSESRKELLDIFKKSL